MSQQTERAPVTVRQVRGVSLIALDDAKANALDFERIEGIRGAMEEAASRSEAIVIAGRPGFFCGGLDLATMQSGSPGEASRLRDMGIDLFRSMISLGVPVISACTGHAVAGGAMMLLASDLRFGASGTYRIGLTEVSFGVAMSPFALELARLRCGSHSLRTTVLSAVDGPDDAARRGLLDLVVDEPIDKALEAAAALGRSPGIAAFASAKARFFRTALAA